MARVLVSDVDKYSQHTNVEFFKLPNDKDTAVVRFILDTPDDVDVLAVHEVEIPGMAYKRKVSCLKNDPADGNGVCPLCDNGELTSISVYLQMLVYEQDKDGYYTQPPKRVVWERGKSYLKKIFSLANRYCSRGKKLIDTVFEIERSGKMGDKQTSYEIYPMNELDENECPIPEDIERFDPLGTIVMDKSYDELMEFVETGVMPDTKIEKSVEEVTARPIANQRPVREVAEESVQATEPARPIRRRI